MKLNRRALLFAAPTIPLLTGCGADSPAQAAAAAPAQEGDPMPRFTARTLDGKMTLDNAAIQGKTLLMQFWATWCGYCRRDQPAVDKVTQEFATRGLIVLAVNVGEDADKVREYLHEHPRRCQVALAKDTNLQRIFRAEGFPKYVVVNRDGKIAGVQDGAGGILALRDLLGGAGLKSDS